MDKIGYIETWTESERGWGTRPDGISIHKSKEDYQIYMEKFCKEQSSEVPDEYSRADSKLRVANISDRLYEKMTLSKNGIRIWQHNLKDIKDEINYLL